jgi:hypothetical protein
VSPRDGATWPIFALQPIIFFSLAELEQAVDDRFTKN